MAQRLRGLRVLVGASIAVLLSALLVGIVLASHDPYRYAPYGSDYASLTHSDCSVYTGICFTYSEDTSGYNPGNGSTFTWDGLSDYNGFTNSYQGCWEVLWLVGHSGSYQYTNFYQSPITYSHGLYPYQSVTWTPGNYPYTMWVITPGTSSCNDTGTAAYNVVWEVQ